MQIADVRNALQELYPALASLAPLRFDELFAGAQVMEVPAGTVMFDEHQACNGFPMLLEGAIKDELGSVREIVTRLLRSFEDHGWLALSREQIEIRDAAALRDIAASG